MKIAPQDWIVRQDGTYGFDVIQVIRATAQTVFPARRAGRYTPNRVPISDVRFVGSEAACLRACEQMVSSKALASQEKAAADDRHRARIVKMMTQGEAS